ncbi:MAG: hypothetical protein M3299_01235 [Thermoproteota archaeon]|nr:hypothetical protein [Thermoproteota archaeon]
MIENHIIVIIHRVLLMRRNESAECYPFQGIASTIICSRVTDKQTNRQTDKQTNRQTDKQTNREREREKQQAKTCGYNATSYQRSWFSSSVI